MSMPAVVRVRNLVSGGTCLGCLGHRHLIVKTAIIRNARVSHCVVLVVGVRAASRWRRVLAKVAAVCAALRGLVTGGRRR